MSEVQEIVITEKHKIGLNRFQFFNNRIERPFRIASFLPERIETERAKLALERTSPGCQYRVEGTTAESNVLLNKVIIVPSQGAVGKRNTC